ncbi:hypothetical protein SShM2_059 [Synechococcus phage S-ShM2]|uniref:Uncharacterized protein n=2 Tax=Ahtivirus sagseatwo TaxID=2734079 RepID=A0A1D7SI49_9CAUD|nr:hypothetical protein SShM2_059 [Synechococcus phage S-ShM2]ADO97670.1 hypothetical protein SShM2_059 [Synechococcus phage S-ShM2]AOO13386.1 hypothetical protein LIS110610_056 [Cyanophage S-RIM14]
MDYTNTVQSLPIYEKWESSKQSIWEGSKFQSFRNIPSPKSKGSQGEKLVQQFMEHFGHKVTKPQNTDHDRIIDGYKTEIKLSTTWNEILSNWTWQQIRDQDYDRLIFVGINPNGISLWWATKSDIKKYILGRDGCRQHAGKDGGQELYWIQGSSGEQWFREMSTW